MRAAYLYVRSSPRSPLTSGWNCCPFRAQHLFLPCMQPNLHELVRLRHPWNEIHEACDRSRKKLQVEEQAYLVSKAPKREGPEGVIELHDGTKGCHCAFIHTCALAVCTCTT